MNKMQQSNNTFIKGLEEIKNKKTGMNNTFTVIKNTPEGINSRITEVEEEISELEDRMVEITVEELNKEKRKKIEGSLRDLCDNIKLINIQIIRVSEEKEKNKRS